MSNLLQAARELGDGELNQLFLFGIGASLFAVSPNWVDSVIAPYPVTPTPGVPGHIKGLCAVQNKVVTVFDSRFFLVDFNEISDADTPARYLILSANGMEAAIPIYKSLGFKSIKEFQIDESGNSVVYSANDVIKGLIRHQDGIVKLLNVPALLTAARVSLEEEAV